jgi:hypothetical protein
MIPWAPVWTPVNIDMCEEAVFEDGALRLSKTMPSRPRASRLGDVPRG